MTSQDDGRKVEREESEDDGQGRRTQRDDDGREGWTPDAEKPQRAGDVTSGEPNDADAPGTEVEESQRTGDVPTGDPDADGPDAGAADDAGADRDVGDFDPPLESREYPVTTGELRKAYGEVRVDTDAGPKPLKELLEPADGETFGSADEVRGRIRKLADR